MRGKGSSFGLELGFSDVVVVYPCCVGSGHQPNALLFKVYAFVKVWLIFLLGGWRGPLNGIQL